MEWLDIFNSDAFSVTSLVASINKIQMVPGRVSASGIFAERRVSTLHVAVEERNGQLSLVDPTPRGTSGETRPKLQRTARKITIPHYQIDDAMTADELQGVREFGSTAMRSYESFMAERMQVFTPAMDATLEYQRVGALCGKILDKSGGILYNLFDEFGVTEPTAVNFVLSDATDDQRGKCAFLSRYMARNLGGIPFAGIKALVGDAFWDTLVRHPLVRDTYRYQEGAALRAGIAYKSFMYGDIEWENYKGYIAPIDGGADNGSDVVPFIDTDLAHFFPVGAPNFAATYFAPADYFDAVNTLGLPRYAKVTPDRKGKVADLEMQQNPLSLIHRPRALIKGTHS